jgi:phosphopantetheinyl transferase (holo-ACP synthase)
MIRGIGIDLVQIPRMREVVARWEERFLYRVFTDHELA